MVSPATFRHHDDVQRRAPAVMARVGDSGDEDGWLERHRGNWAVGTVDDVVEHLRRLEDAGVARVMLQHIAHDDTDMVLLLGEVARRCP